MNAHQKLNEGVSELLMKADHTVPALIVTGPDAIAIREGVVFGGLSVSGGAFALTPPEGGYKPGTDYVVAVANGVVRVIAAKEIPQGEQILGGFHFAPGGNATAREGGDDKPAINPFSVWDRSFRPACPDPRGMTLVEGPRGKFWSDIYLLGRDHLKGGTSAFGVTIADGDDTPGNPDGGKPFESLDYATAVAVMKHHGKQLLAFDEFFAAAFGVKERSALGKDPKKTKCDPERTSRCGVQQATGNLWVWGHDGDPDDPRPSIFGGSWVRRSGAGSRFADLGSWPGLSSVSLGARGRSDHLQPA